MQTLTAGSFLNLENAESVEALKFTARRLAEHTANVVAENLTDSALESLTNNLWDRAEYVARETERRGLREIFARNFTERFRELKPKFSPEDVLVSEVLSAAATNGNANLIEKVPAAPQIVEGGESETAASESAFSASVQPEADSTEVEGTRDEFLGFVKTDEPFAGTQKVAETESAAAINTTDEAEPETIQARNPTFPETLKTENESAATHETTNSEGEKVIAEKEVTAKSADDEKSQPAAATVAAGNNSQPVNANKNGANKTETKEPFEFGKCTISLNLVLLPSAVGESKRKAIVSASSHNLPPEIEFLEIGEGENLKEITDLVRDKLARFKHTLPAKYIEQLRQSKTKSAKKTAPAKTQTAVSTLTRPESIQPNVEKTNGSQTAQSSSASETEKSRAEITATKENVSAQPATTAAVVPQSQIAANNNVQPSLF